MMLERTLDLERTTRRISGRSLGVWARIRRHLRLVLMVGGVLVVAVGNLVVRKGHRVLLEALHQLSANGTGCWRLAVAGRGRLKESLQQLAAEQEALAAARSRSIAIITAQPIRSSQARE